MRRDFRVPVCAFMLIPATLGFSQQPSTHDGGTSQVAADPQSDGLSEFEATIKGYAEAIQRDPENAESWARRGTAWYNAGEFDKAIADYTESIRLNPNNAAAYYGRGNAWHYKGDYDKAIVDYGEMIRLESENADAYTGRGSSWRAKGEYTKAIADFSEAIRCDPNDAHAYRSRGSALHYQGEYDKAIDDYTDAIRLEADDAYSYRGRGGARCGLGQQQLAIADYNEAIRLDPENADAYRDRGYTLSTLEKFDQAIIDYTEAIRLNPAEPLTYSIRGKAWLHLGQHDKAIADLTKSIELLPSSGSYYGRGTAWSLKGRHDKAIADYTEAIRIDPTRAQVFYDRGYQWQATGLYDKAIADYDEAIRLDPTNSLVYILRGNAWHQSGEYRKAIVDYTEANRLQPCYAGYHNRALAWLEIGENEKAEADREQAKRFDPSNVELLLPPPATETTCGPGIDTAALLRAISGDWEDRPDFVEDQKGEVNYAFFDRIHGSLMHVQVYSGRFASDPAFQERFVKAMLEAESFWGERSHPRFARLLANEFFVPPDRYNEAIAPSLAQAMAQGSRVSTLYIWDMNDIEGDAHLFYTSQLTPRIATELKKATRPTGEQYLQLHVGEEYVPLRMTRAERETLESGEAVVLELETRWPAIGRAIQRFGMPATLRGQRIRYGLVIYGGKDSDPERQVWVLYATPVSSGLNHAVVLNALHQEL